MPLTESVIRNARPRERSYRLSDGRGLCLLVQPTGAKWWRFRYEFDRTERLLSFGIYPDVPLVDAREHCNAARRQVVQGVNPRVESGEPSKILG